MEPAMLVRKYVSMLSSPFCPYLPSAGETLSSLILLSSSFAAFPLISFIFSAHNHEKSKRNLILLNQCGNCLHSLFEQYLVVSRVNSCIILRNPTDPTHKSKEYVYSSLLLQSHTIRGLRELRNE